METVISATQARIRFGEVMREAQKRPVVVERDGIPQVVILSKQHYDALVQGKTSTHRGLLDEAHRRIRSELAGRTLPSSEELIRQIREERDDQFNDLH